jgi:hypothetical protein
MTVVHVENADIDRATLKDHLKVAQGRLDEREYVDTAIVADAEQRLRAGRVEVLVLDIGLNIPVDNETMPALLRRLVQFRQHPDSQAQKDCDAYRLAHLAAHRGVPCALLTNWPDYMRNDKSVTQASLRKAFGVEEVFDKDSAGFRACAAWVRQKLR